MNRYEFTHKGVHYERVNKTAARKAYVAGIDVVLCAVKLSPFSAWGTGNRINRKYREDFYIDDTSAKNDFDNLVNSFEFYNCNYNETGYYCAYYIASI